MAKPEWGAKRVCQSCANKFYDLGRSPIVCSKCGVEFDPEALLRSRRSRPATTVVEPAKPAMKPTKVVEADLDEAVAGEDFDIELSNGEENPAGLSDDDEDKDSVIEDTSELGEDETDLAGVVVTGGDKD